MTAALTPPPTPVFECANKLCSFNPQPADRLAHWDGVGVRSAEYAGTARELPDEPAGWYCEECLAEWSAFPGMKLSELIERQGGLAKLADLQPETIKHRGCEIHIRPEPAVGWVVDVSDPRGLIEQQIGRFEGRFRHAVIETGKQRISEYLRRTGT